MNPAGNLRPVFCGMDLEKIRNYCLDKPAVTEEQPFGPETLVFKVAGKIFALMPLDGTESTINLKCAPERALELRDRYPDIRPGYHMNKRHWNTLYLDGGTLPDPLLRELIDHSYARVVAGLTKKMRLTYALREPGAE